jgi:hypothetical protein
LFLQAYKLGQHHFCPIPDEHSSDVRVSSEACGIPADALISHCTLDAQAVMLEELQCLKRQGVIKEDEASSAFHEAGFFE